MDAPAAPVEVAPVTPVIDAPAAPVEVAPVTPVMDAPAAPVNTTPAVPSLSNEPVIYGGANPGVGEISVNQETNHQIYGGADPLQNTQPIPTVAPVAPVENVVTSPVEVAPVAPVTNPVEVAPVAPVTNPVEVAPVAPVADATPVVTIQQ